MKNKSFQLVSENDNIILEELDFIPEETEAFANVDLRYNSIQATIDMLFVHSEYRGQKLSKRLMNKVISFSKENSLKRVRLVAYSFKEEEIEEEDVHTAIHQEALVKFYESFGFHTYKVDNDGLSFMELNL